MSIIQEIIAKKELQGISISLVKEILDNYLKKHNIKIPRNSKQRKIIIKEIRTKLRKYVGRFQSSSSHTKRLSLLQKNKIPQLLKTHSSTKERLPYYSKLKTIIRKIAPKSILDLGCGLNPIALANPKINYIAIDINNKDIEIVKSYFQSKKIHAQTIQADITKLSNFPKTDLTLILKTLDIISRTKSKQFLKKIKSKNIIVSFSTRTLSNKPMNHPKRIWFENILKNLNYKYKVTKTSNEIFYVIENLKSKSN